MSYWTPRTHRQDMETLIATLISEFVPVVLDFISEQFNLIVTSIFIFTSIGSVYIRSNRQKLAQETLKGTVEGNIEEPVTLHPVVNVALCAGCGGCTRACPEGDILQLVNHKAVLVSPSKCVGHGSCEAACPMGAITLVFGTKTRGVEIPRLTKNYESNIPGLYVAGELAGMGLIANAIKQGALAAQHSFNKPRTVDSKLISGIETDNIYDLIVVGAGPAGLAACLEAIASKKKYLCIEQNTFGGAVANYPRRKVVTTQQLELPGISKMKFKNSRIEKEELLRYWMELKKRSGLKVSEGEKFLNLKKSHEGFQVESSKGRYTARSVILCLGVRGSPRRLGLVNENLPKVMYGLSDASEFSRLHIAIVGGGNSAVEAAMSLAQLNLENRITLIVHGATLSRCNDWNRKKIEIMSDKNLVKICFHSKVKEIEPGDLTIESQNRFYKIKNDFLFVLIGAEAPSRFLQDLGIKVDKKFAHPLGANPIEIQQSL